MNAAVQVVESVAMPALPVAGVPVSAGAGLDRLVRVGLGAVAALVLGIGALIAVLPMAGGSSRPAKSRWKRM